MKIDKLGQRINIDNRGKLGRSGGFGRISFGYNTFGLYSFFYGIYKNHATQGKKVLIKTRFYRPTNPRTEKQELWRSFYAESISLWQEKTEYEKLVYNVQGERLKMSGFNLFIKEYLNEKKAEFSKKYG